MKTRPLWIMMLGLLLLPGSAAAATQNPAQIRDTARAFAQAQTRGLPGKTSIEVGELDHRLSLPACPRLEAFLAPGVQLNGNSNVGVRCNVPRGWSVFVPVLVKTSSSVLTLKRTLNTGQHISAGDLGSLSSDTVQAGALTDPAQAVGMVMKYGVGAGQILRYDMLRAPYTVKLGQTVQLRVQGPGYSVSNEAQALGNAANGDSITARTAGGQIVSGIARNGTIEILQ